MKHNCEQVFRSKMRESRVWFYSNENHGVWSAPEKGGKSKTLVGPLSNISGSEGHVPPPPD